MVVGRNDIWIRRARPIFFLDAAGVLPQPVGAGAFEGHARMVGERRQAAQIAFSEGVEGVGFEIERADDLVAEDNRHGQFGARRAHHRDIARVLADVGHVDRMASLDHRADDPLSQFDAFLELFMNLFPFGAFVADEHVDFDLLHLAVVDEDAGGGEGHHLPQRIENRAQHFFNRRTAGELHADVHQRLVLLPFAFDFAEEFEHGLAAYRFAPDGEEAVGESGVGLAPAQRFHKRAGQFRQLAQPQIEGLQAFAEAGSAGDVLEAEILHQRFRPRII